MENNMTRMLVGTFVRKALKDIQECPNRGIRNLVDMTLQFSEGRFLQIFFLLFRQCFKMKIVLTMN